MPTNTAQKRATKILRESGYSIPVNVKALARTNGISIIADDLDDELSGVLLMKENKPVIFVNKNHHKHRQRFTIAHELGHYLLHNYEGVHVDKDYVVAFRNFASSTGENLREIEANQFAAELLMPAEDIEEYLQGNGGRVTDSVIEALAKAFVVSEQAMAVRLTFLGYI